MNEKITPRSGTAAAAKPTSSDRFDRRFSIDGDALEALKAVLDDTSGKSF